MTSYPSSIRKPGVALHTRLMATGPACQPPCPAIVACWRRIRQQSGQPIFSRSAFGSSTRRSRKSDATPAAEQLDGLRSSEVSSLAERIFEENYKIGELLGIGSFGKVYRATHRSGSGPDYAVKIVSKHREGFQDERVARRIHEEVRQLLIHVVHLRKVLCKRSSVHDCPLRALC